MGRARSRVRVLPHAGVPTRRGHSGFSLAEVTVALVIIMLFVGAIATAHALVVQAQIKNTVQSFNRALAALHAYGDRYAAAPGDDARAAIRWSGGAKNGTGDGVLSGAFHDVPPPGNPLTTLTVDAAQGETLNFWWHLRLAGFLQYAPGAANPAMPPPSGFGGIIGVQQTGLGLNTLIVCQSSVPEQIAVGAETEMDDGNPATGEVRGVLQTTAGLQALGEASPVTSYTETGTNRYILCHSS